MSVIGMAGRPWVVKGADGPEAVGRGLAVLPVKAAMVSSVAKGDDVAVGSDRRRLSIWGYMEGEAHELILWANGEAKMGRECCNGMCRYEVRDGGHGRDASLLRMADSSMVCFEVEPRAQVRAASCGAAGEAWVNMRARHEAAWADMVQGRAGLRWVEVSRGEEDARHASQWTWEDMLMAISARVVAEREAGELGQSAAQGEAGKRASSI